MYLASVYCFNIVMSMSLYRSDNDTVYSTVKLPTGKQVRWKINAHNHFSRITITRRFGLETHLYSSALVCEVRDLRVMATLNEFLS